MNQLVLRSFWLFMVLALLAGNRGCKNTPAEQKQSDTVPVAKETTMETDAMSESDMPQTEDQWKKKLTPEQYRILREKGTERAFTGEYDEFFEPGTYACAGCGQMLFTSESKYNSGCGWPAFYKPADEKVVQESRDTSHGMVRIEITCSNCGGHLGHVFNDGPEPTGLRYCINSASLEFEEKDEQSPKE